MLFSDQIFQKNCPNILLLFKLDLIPFYQSTYFVWLIFFKCIFKYFMNQNILYLDKLDAPCALEKHTHSSVNTNQSSELIVVQVFYIYTTDFLSTVLPITIEGFWMLWLCVWNFLFFLYHYKMTFYISNNTLYSVIYFAVNLELQFSFD